MLWMRENSSTSFLPALRLISAIFLKKYFKKMYTKIKTYDIISVSMLA